TTLVQALESGLDAAGADIAAFNCLLMRVKTARYDELVLERELRDACARLERHASDVSLCDDAPAYVREWYSPEAAAELLFWRGLVGDYEHADVLSVVLARAARSARRTTHFDLDFPRRPQLAPYWCHKHRRQCRPVGTARQFLRRYALDTLARVKAFARVRRLGRDATILHGDSRVIDWDGAYDGIVTSPPYPGLIDYHEQHRYAYELLGLDDRRELELGAAARGTGRDALAAYGGGIAGVLRKAARALTAGAPVVIVVNDARDLYPKILDAAGLELEE